MCSKFNTQKELFGITIKTMRIRRSAVITFGIHEFSNPIILAPMAGISDRPFRALCQSMGADYTVSEMIGADPKFRHTARGRRRINLENINGLRVVQIAGAQPTQLADSARFVRDQGAEVVDINMGCPAKKVCNRLAGSALMKDEALVAELLEAVVSAVDLPVTLKMRTGWDRHNKNAVRIAKLAEQIGVRTLTVHGRTRACAYKGTAEFDTVAEVKAAVDIPVIANGDITNALQAKQVLDYTACDGLMIGRGAQGNPWIFAAIRTYLSSGEHVPPPSGAEVLGVLAQHLVAMHDFYGDLAIKMSRKHIAWYSQWLVDGVELRHEFNQLNTQQSQIRLIEALIKSGHCKSHQMDAFDNDNNDNGALAA